MRFNTQKKSADRFDLYRRVTSEIVMSLASGVIPWRKRWASPVFEGDFTNFVSGRPYSAINRMCFLTRPGRYMTFLQVQGAGGRIREGARSRPVVFNSMFIPADRKQEAERLEKAGKPFDHLKRFCLRYYNVFHEDDIEGVEGLAKMVPAQRDTRTADLVVSDYCRRTGITVAEEDTDRAVWDPDTRRVTVPARRQFRTEEQFYAVLFGMLASSTRGRMDRHGQEGQEELTCEMASAMVMNGLGLDTEASREDTMAECGKWIRVLNRNFHTAVTAAAAAEKAARFILEPAGT